MNTPTTEEDRRKAERRHQETEFDAAELQSIVRQKIAEDRQRRAVLIFTAVLVVILGVIVYWRGH